MVNRQTKAQEMVELGTEYFHGGRLAEARDCFFHAIEMDPANSAALNAYATVLCEMNSGEWNDQAAHFLLQSLQADPRNVKALNNLGDYYYRKGDFDQAVEFFERAALIDPVYPIPYVNMALCYRNTNRTEDALKALRKALSLDPYSGWARYQLAMTYLQRGMRHENLEDVEKARQVLISIEEKVIPCAEYPVDRMIRMISSYLTMHRNTSELHQSLSETTQFFGDARDDEAFACLLN